MYQVYDKMFKKMLIFCVHFILLTKFFKKYPYTYNYMYIISHFIIFILLPDSFSQKNDFLEVMIRYNFLYMNQIINDDFDI